jgi:hypothetical protein
LDVNIRFFRRSAQRIERGRLKESRNGRKSWFDIPAAAGIVGLKRPAAPARLGGATLGRS